MAVEVVRGANFWNISAGGAGSVLLVDAAGNPVAYADKAPVAQTPGGLIYNVVNDGVARNGRGDVTGGQGLARVTSLFMEMVDGAAVNTQLWTQSLTTMTAVQVMRLLTLNAGLSVASGAVAIHTSLQQFVKPRGAVLRVSARMRFNWTTANNVQEFGFLNPVGTTASPANGAFLRVTNTGTVELVYSFNSIEQSIVVSSIDPATGINPASFYDVDIWLNDESVRCVVQRSDSALSVSEPPVIDTELRFGVSQIAEWNAISSPIAFRTYNSAIVASASTLSYSGVAVYLYDLDACKPWAEQLAASMRGVLMNPASGAQLANYGNSAAPASATLSNTSVGYATLGGQWQFGAVVGAETDYGLFGFVVPVGRTLHVKRVVIDAWVMGAASATTPTLLQWALGREAAATLAANTFRKTIGSQSIPVGTPIGGSADKRVDWAEAAAFVVDSGQTFHVILKMPVGSATASQIIRGVVAIDGYLQ